MPHECPRTRVCGKPSSETSHNRTQSYIVAAAFAELAPPTNITMLRLGCHGNLTHQFLDEPMISTTVTRSSQRTSIGLPPRSLINPGGPCADPATSFSHRHATNAQRTCPGSRPRASNDNSFVMKSTHLASFIGIHMSMYLVAFADAACVTINADVAKTGYRSSSFEDDCIVFTSGVSKLGKNSLKVSFWTR